MTVWKSISSSTPMLLSLEAITRHLRVVSFLATSSGTRRSTQRQTTSGRKMSAIECCRDGCRKYYLFHQVYHEQNLLHRIPIPPCSLCQRGVIVHPACIIFSLNQIFVLPEVLSYLMFVYPLSNCVAWSWRNRTILADHTDF